MPALPRVRIACVLVAVSQSGGGGGGVGGSGELAGDDTLVGELEVSRACDVGAGDAGAGERGREPAPEKPCIVGWAGACRMDWAGKELCMLDGAGTC
jgi:hypothetical protein